MANIASRFMLLKNKKLWGSFFIAVALWVYTGLNEQYSVVIEVPLAIEPPKDRAIEEVLPNTITANAVGNGWYLLNYMYVNNVKKCSINLSNVSHNDSLYTITSADLRKGLTGINKIRTNHFYPEQFVIKTGEISSKEVPIIPNIKLNLKEGFILASDIRLDPPTVSIIGNKKILDSIEKWYTAQLIVDNVKSDFSQVIRLSDSLNSVAQITPATTTLYAKVAQYGEVFFDDIPLEVVGGQLPANHIIAPKYFRVTLSGGINLLKNISANDLKITIDYDKIVNDTTGFLIPQINVPQYTKILDIYPRHIGHVARVSA